MSRGDGMPPQEQERGPRCGTCNHTSHTKMCRVTMNSGTVHEVMCGCFSLRGMEEGPAGGEAGSKYTYLGSEVATSDEVRLPGYQIGHQRGLEAGEKGMRERAAKSLCPGCAGLWHDRYSVEPVSLPGITDGRLFHLQDGKEYGSIECYASKVRALPLSVADGPAPATEESDKDDLLEAAWGVIANAGEGSWERESRDWQTAAAAWRERWFRLIALPPGTPLQPASSSPTAPVLGIHSVGHLQEPTAEEKGCGCRYECEGKVLVEACDLHQEIAKLRGQRDHYKKEKHRLDEERAALLACRDSWNAGRVTIPGPDFLEWVAARCMVFESLNPDGGVELDYAVRLRAMAKAARKALAAADAVVKK